MNHFPKLLLLLIFLSGASLAAQNVPHQPGEFLVSLSEGLDTSSLLRKMPSLTAKKVSNLLNIWLLRSDLPEEEVLAWLLKQPEVRLVQFNHILENRSVPHMDKEVGRIYTHAEDSTLPNDPLFPHQWHLLNDGQAGGIFDADLDAEQAWDITTGGLTPAGDTIVIAVIDGGLDAAHPDLAPNLWYNHAEIPNNGLDDDGNGYSDDFRGWNVFAESDDIEGNSTAHGTPVSAILGARGNNGLGVTGVNWNTKIMFVAASGSEAAILEAYDYVFQARKKYNTSSGEKGAFVVAVNCSWGINYGQPALAPLWCEAFDQLGAAGIVSVAATANLPINIDLLGDLPTACPSNFLISVTSLNKSDIKADNAAWGSQHVDLGAYGQDVFTAAAGGGYGQFYGTSFAAPQVAGAVGLLYSAPCPNLIALAKIDPASAAYWAKSLLLENVTPNPSLSGKSLTDGRLNLFKSLQNYENQCSNCPAPFALKTEALTDVSVMLLWSSPPASTVTQLRWRMLGTGPWIQLTDVQDTFLLSGLTVCTVYEFELQTICEGGIASAWSQPYIFQTKGCCTAPASVWLENCTYNAAEIAWEASGFNNTYRVRLREAGTSGWDIFEPVTSLWVFENLKSCTKYEVQVQARCEDWLTDFSAIFSFQTKGCGACNEVIYCDAKGESASEEWISSVQIGAWFHFSGPGGNGYQNFGSAQSDFPQLIAQNTIPVIITPGFSGALSKEYFRIFIDFNQDGDFDDDDELAFDPGFALEGVAEGLIQVPAIAIPGITRLRVMMKYTSPNDDPPTSCTSFDFGQVEDYCAELLLDSLNTSISSADTVWQLRAYPQPAHDWVMLELTESVSTNTCEIEVVDMTGRIILYQSSPMLRNGRFYLDTNAWACGLYAVKAMCGEKVMRGKLIRN